MTITLNNRVLPHLGADIRPAVADKEHWRETTPSRSALMEALQAVVKKEVLK